MSSPTRPPRGDDLLLAPESPLDDVVRWAVAHAVLAPSELNTQPWRFRASVDDRGGWARVDLVLDRSRVLNTDAGARGAILACGAALLDLRLALHGAELGTVVRLCPSTAAPDLLASVEVRGRVAEDAADRLLREAVPRRASRRRAFEPGALPAELLDRLVAEAAYEGALAAPLTATALAGMRGVDALAGARSAADQGRAQERARWMRVDSDSADDGVPGSSYGLGLVGSLMEPRRLRRGTSRATAAPVDAADATVLVVASASDDRPALLRCGAGLQRLLLAATTAGVSARFLNDALRFPDLRAEVVGLSGTDHPHALLHLGYGAPDSTTRRRPVEDVLELSGPPGE